MQPNDQTIATITQRLRESASVTEAMGDRAADIARAASLIAQSVQRGGKLLLCGNGGSAADCQHVAAEFVGRLTQEKTRPAMPALALTTDTSFLTAYANDLGFEGVFARQIEALGTAGDVLLAISTSGSSPNVMAGVAAARRKGVAVIALLGEAGPLAESADVAIRVPSRDTQLVQQVHLAVEHLICHLVEQALYS
ncbi:MAG TPA: SIS domain-containing protein [Vicinamibacterales bacterium]|jgi:D-sedoheptulose 7-phosphate isomerase|nr:SIS domain-containing protein [Vicinamibacterales bacterium]